MHQKKIIIFIVLITFIFQATALPYQYQKNSKIALETIFSKTGEEKNRAIETLAAQYAALINQNKIRLSYVIKILKNNPQKDDPVLEILIQKIKEKRENFIYVELSRNLTNCAFIDKKLILEF